MSALVMKQNRQFLRVVKDSVKPPKLHVCAPKLSAVTTLTVPKSVWSPSDYDTFIPSVYIVFKSLIKGYKIFL